MSISDCAFERFAGRAPVAVPAPPATASVSEPSVPGTARADRMLVSAVVSTAAGAVPTVATAAGSGTV
ncbi:hypothetical protein GCM10010199_59570 [Dactylosporangium roseum]